MYLPTQNERLPDKYRGGVVAIGNFDGVHLGHQALIAKAKSQSDANDCPLGVLTFEPHPRTFFRREEPVFRLSTPQGKAQLLKGLGVQFLDVTPFNLELASLEAEAFVEQILVERLGVSHVVTGYDFHFGKGRKGSPDTMRKLGEKLGFGVSIVEQVTDTDGIAPYSSSAVRTALRRGHVEKAAHQLGHWWSVLGTVVQGDQRGRTIGYPTANIALDPGCEPHEGIYAVRVRLEEGGQKKCYPAAGYIGYRPTFETERMFLEVFIFDFDRDIYGQEIAVDFVKFIRPDKKFNGLDELLVQMEADCKIARKTLIDLASNDPMTGYQLGALQANCEL